MLGNPEHGGQRKLRPAEEEIPIPSLKRALLALAEAERGESLAHGGGREIVEPGGE